MTDFAIGATIRQIRKQRDMTLLEVSTLAGISTPFLSDIERDKTNLSLKTLAAIADALGTPMHALFLEATGDRSMQVDKDTKIPTAGNQSIGELAHSIVAYCSDPFQPVDTAAVEKIQNGLMLIWMAGYQMGMLDESRRIAGDK